MPAAGKRKSSDQATSQTTPKSRKSSKDDGKIVDNSADEEDEEEEHRGGGELVYSGITDFKAAKGQATDSIIWEFSRLSCLQGIPICLVASSSTSMHSVIISADGKIFTWGRGGSGQLGIGECPDQVQSPTRVKALEKYQIKSAATGAAHTLVLTADGAVFGFGANAMGQLGIGNFEAAVAEPTKMLSKKVFKKISCGSNFSMIADAKGYLYSCGYTEYGRLGHGFPKEIIEGKNSFENENRARRLLRYTVKDPKTNATKDLEGIKIVDVACGAEHTIALDDNGRVFTWGFGGYGRLGHGSPADEVFPRLVNTFLGERRTAKRIWAGACGSLALNEVGCLTYWGRARGDDITYPKPVDPLRKKKIHSIGISGNAFMAHADNELYTWSYSSTLGEMALTDAQKSSSDTLQVPLPPGCSVRSLTCGYSSTLCTVDAGEGKENSKKEVLDAFPMVTLDE